MSYLINTWYVEYADGRLEPCQNWATAVHLVANTEAICIRDITREVLMA